MICNDVSECFEQISAYFSGDCTGFFLLVDTEDYDTFRRYSSACRRTEQEACMFRTLLPERAAGR
ncbi:MAG: hypothetical protein ACLSG5_11785 [Oscillospiraceae bacterium]